MKRQKDLSQSTKERLEVIAKLLFKWKQENDHSMEVFETPFKVRIWSKVVDPELERLGMIPRAANDWARPNTKAYIMNLLNNMDVLNPIEQSEPSEEPFTQQSIYPEQSEPCEQSGPSEPTEPIVESDSYEPSDLDAKIDDRIQQKIAALTSASFLQDLPLPPPRKKEKRLLTKGKRKGIERMKEIRDYVRPSFSIDKRIFKRFEKEVTKRGMTQSTLLEAILIKVFDLKLED